MSLSAEALAALQEHLGADVSVDDLMQAQTTGGGRGLRKLVGEVNEEGSDRGSDDSDTLQMAWVEGGDSVAPPCHVAKDKIPTIIEFLELESHDVLYDLGCGDGRVCIAGVAAGAASACGIEIEEALVQKFKGLIDQAEAAGDVPAGSVRAVLSDLRAQTLEDATAVYCYLLPEVFPLIHEILLSVLQRGGRLICNTWGPKEWTPVQTCDVENVTLLKYTLASTL